MPKRTSVSSPKDIMLSMIFVTAIVLGFGMVWYVDYSYAGNGPSDTVLLFQTDTDTEFPEYDLSTASFYNPDWTSGTNHQWRTLSDLYQTNYTPAYLGNQTWAVSVGSTATDTYTTDTFQTYINLPNLDRWVITKIEINTTLPADDIDLTAIMYHHVDPFPYTISQFSVDPDQFTILNSWTYTTESQADVSYNVPLTKALRIYDLAQENPYGSFRLAWNDDNLDGFTGFACQFTVKIYGTQQTGWTVQDSLSLALGTSVLLNVGVMVYMTDMVDIGPDIKDLPKRRKR